MGKIGDLFVRLGLKSDEFKKGMNDAQKQTEGFGGKLGKMKAVAVAAWAAVGAAAMKFAKDVIASTNRTADAWDMFIAKSKAGWTSFLQTLSSWNWDNWIGRIKEATRAAEELQSALDASFEIKNSIELQKAAMAEELANLQILMRDVSKPWYIRKKAAEDYLAKIKTVFEQEKALANKMLDAQQGRWLAGTGLTDNEQTRADLAKFLVDYGKTENKELLDALALVRGYETRKNMRKMSKMSQKDQLALGQQYQSALSTIGAFEQANGYQSGSLVGLSKAYENLRGDKDTEPLVQALIGSYNADAAEAESTRRVHAVINQAKAAAQTEIESFNATLAGDLQEGLDAAFAEIDNFDDSFADIELEIPEIDTTNLDKSIEEIKQKAAAYEEEMQKVAELNGMLEESMVAALDGGMQAFTDMLMGIEGADANAVLSALMTPFADTAQQLGMMLIKQGLAVEAFKKSLDTLQGIPAIAAGTALLAVSAAMKSGIRSLASGAASGTSTGASYGGSSVGSAAQNYESTLTVEVVGKISGNDINIVGKKAAYSKNR